MIYLINFVWVNKMVKNNGFYDNEYKLFWLNGNQTYSEMFDEFDEEVSTWDRDPAIKRYVDFDKSISEKFRDLIEEDKDYRSMYYCFNDEVLVGVVLLTSASEFSENNCVEYIITNPNARNCGMGTKMLRSVLSNTQYFFKNNVTNVEAIIDERNVKSLVTFEYAGFKMKDDASSTEQGFVLMKCDGKIYQNQQEAEM